MVVPDRELVKLPGHLRKLHYFLGGKRMRLSGSLTDETHLQQRLGQAARSPMPGCRFSPTPCHRDA
jgi:hypothetical protein